MCYWSLLLYQCNALLVSESDATACGGMEWHGIAMCGKSFANSSYIHT